MRVPCRPSYRPCRNRQTGYPAGTQLQASALPRQPSFPPRSQRASSECRCAQTGWRLRRPADPAACHQTRSGSQRPCFQHPAVRKSCRRCPADTASAQQRQSGSLRAGCTAPCPDAPACSRPWRAPTAWSRRYTCWSGAAVQIPRRWRLQRAGYPSFSQQLPADRVRLPSVRHQALPVRSAPEQCRRNTSWSWQSCG